MSLRYLTFVSSYEAAKYEMKRHVRCSGLVYVGLLERTGIRIGDSGTRSMGSDWLSGTACMMVNPSYNSLPCPKAEFRSHFAAKGGFP